MTTITGDLEAAFSTICQELAATKKATFRVTVQGQPKVLRPPIRDEAYRIVREALLNASRHSDADLIEIDIEYGPTRLRLVVRDDGSGMTPESLGCSFTKHRGLLEMRERADHIGGKLKLSSSLAAGTEVELTIPKHFAFLPPSEPQRFQWFGRFKVSRLDDSAGCSDRNSLDTISDAQFSDAVLDVNFNAFFRDEQTLRDIAIPVSAS
ncbi:MAG: ATP-binding protein [Bryobacteraceae bacterium]|jgi:hypothetical protein